MARKSLGLCVVRKKSTSLESRLGYGVETNCTYEVEAVRNPDQDAGVEAQK